MRVHHVRAAEDHAAQRRGEEAEDIGAGALRPWRFERGDRTVTLDPPPAFVSNSSDTLRTAAIAGMGIAALSADHAADAMADGRLTRLLTDWNWTVPANYLYYANRRHMSGALRAFIDAMRRSPE